MFCPKCGAPDPGTGAFCSRCGAQLRAAVASEPPPTFVVRPGVDQRQQVANYWHTLFLIVLMLALSLSGARRTRTVAEMGHRPLLYTTTIILQFALVGYVYIGVRRRGYKLRDLTGAPWKKFEEAALDFGIAAASWFVAVLLLALLATGLGLVGRTEELRHALDFLAPSNGLELAMWVALATTAGICEEIVYRGYMQRQFASLSGNIVIGVVAQAVIFGASHAYEGGARMILVGVLGAILGTLAALRKNLRPSMIVHTWQDLLAGFGLFFLRRVMK